VTEGDPSLLFEPGQVIEALHAAEGTVREAGFEIDREFLPEGDGQPSGPLCSFEASRDTDSILVTIDGAVHVVGLEDAPEGALAVQNHGVAPSGRLEHLYDMARAMLQSAT
jgi:hypothetical protein